MIELPKKTEAQKLLDRFIDSEENPENAIRLVFVPEELYSDLKDKGISPVDLLYYDKAVASVGSHALKELIALNALSKSSPLDKNRVHESVEMSEKLTPLMGEALDIRLLWLANATDKEALYSQYFPQENGEYTFDESKLIFYFTAENRLDFRELVKEVNKTFKKRVEFYQIKSNDEGRILCAFGKYGREIYW